MSDFPPSNSLQSDFSRTSKIFWGVVGGIFAISIIIACIQKSRRSMRLREMENIDVERGEDAILGNITLDLLEKPVRFSSKEIAASTSNYATKLGSGGFGDVYKGEMPGGVKLAVKVLKNDSGFQKKLLEDQFMAEVSTIGRTYHINLVRLYGFCYAADIKALVYEYVENGSLDKVLFDSENSIEWDKLYDIAIGAAKGLEYMHHLCRQRIIHYDIKPGNILIDSRFCAKIADFGLAKLCNIDQTHITAPGGKGTPGYAAPELWMPFPVTYKCDIYSFGIMLFEIIGRKRNLNLNSSTNSSSQQWFPRKVWEEYEKGELEKLFIEKGIETKDQEKAKTMAMVALWCVQYLPEDRPSMSSVVKLLESGDEVKKPENPFKHLISSNAELPQWIGTNSSSTSSTRNLYENHISFNVVNKAKNEIEIASLP